MSDKHNCNCNHDHEPHDCECNHEHHEDGCCGHEHHETITLTLDNDETLQCVVIGIFEANENEYIALLPDTQDDVLLYRYEALEGDEIDLMNIEDDDEFELVSSTFLSLLEEDVENNEED